MQWLPLYEDAAGLLRSLPNDFLNELCLRCAAGMLAWAAGLGRTAAKVIALKASPRKGHLCAVAYTFARHACTQGGFVSECSLQCYRTFRLLVF